MIANGLESNKKENVPVQPTILLTEQKMQLLLSTPVSKEEKPQNKDVLTESDLAELERKHALSS